MWRWTWVVLALALAASAGAKEPEPGRTDGPEGSEYGKGGYVRRNSSVSGGGYYAEGYLGSASVNPEGQPTRSNLIAGVNAGYMVEDWLSFQAGFGHIDEQETNLYSIGMRSMYNAEPFNYYFGLGAEIFDPAGQVDNQFGLVPGVGAEMILNERVRVGIDYQHDVVMGDHTTNIDRVGVHVRIGF